MSKDEQRDWFAFLHGCAMGLLSRALDRRRAASEEEAWQIVEEARQGLIIAAGYFYPQGIDTEQATAWQRGQEAANESE